MKLFYRTCDDLENRTELVVPDNALADLEIESSGQVFRVTASNDGLRVNTDWLISVYPIACNSVVIKQVPIP